MWVSFHSIFMACSSIFDYERETHGYNSGSAYMQPHALWVLFFNKTYTRMHMVWPERGRAAISNFKWCMWTPRAQLQHIFRLNVKMCKMCVNLWNLLPCWFPKVSIPTYRLGRFCEDVSVCASASTQKMFTIVNGQMSCSSDSSVLTADCIGWDVISYFYMVSPFIGDDFSKVLLPTCTHPNN